MSTNHTEHYNLSLWEPDDQVTRTEFNENHAKIDAALAGLQTGKANASALESLRGQVPRIAVGTYTGNGTASRTISLGFTPKAVLVFNREGYTALSGSIIHHYGGLAVTGHPCQNNMGELITIVSNGFRVFYYIKAPTTPANKTNEVDIVYHYFAIG